MQVASIYGPILEDLHRVEDNLHALSHSELIPTPDLLDHALADMGKRIRPALTLLSGMFYRYDLKYLLPMATAVELLHIATLVHDDTVDGAALRRSKPTVSSVWGKETALLIGDYLFATSADLVSTTENVMTMRLFAQTLQIISAGELRQTFAAYRHDLPREEYYRRIGSKTASLFSMACETGAILSLAPRESCLALKDYGNHLGIAFQIVDDILDFIGDKNELGKPVGNDLMQGTVTLPAIVFSEMYPGSGHIKEALQRKGDRETVARAVEAVANSPAIKECYRLAGEACSLATSSLRGLPHSPALGPMEALACYVVERNK